MIRTLLDPTDPHVIAAAIATVYAHATDAIDRMDLLLMLELDD